MSLLRKIVEWVDRDIATSFYQLRPLSLVVGIMPMVVIGFPAASLTDPSKTILLLTAGALCLAWVAFWGWRSYLWLVSPDFCEMLRREHEKLPRWLRRKDDSVT